MMPTGFLPWPNANEVSFTLVRGADFQSVVARMRLMK